IESAVYENRTYGAVRGRRLITASYSIAERRKKPEGGKEGADERFLQSGGISLPYHCNLNGSQCKGGPVSV
ncbi:hypothetical protein, partial [Enterocloster clostridioformis]